MKESVSLTVAQSKRLIAKAIAAHPEILRALKSGKIAICAGTTNSYVLEELLGKPIPLFSFTTGITTCGVQPEIEQNTKRFTAVLFTNGTPDFSRTADDIVGELELGDIFIKGCNALNYSEGLAGLLIGHPTGGTIGATLGTLISKKVRIMIPAGLEKVIPFDIIELAREQFEDMETKSWSIFPFTGEIITEIEALKILADCEAYQIGAGGILGAEGAVTLILEGTANQVKTAKEIIAQIASEPPFGIRR